jgi:hypothetical protein
MDGRFVPQLTYGPVVVEAVRRAAKVPLEVHLMIEQPERSLADYASLGADVLTVHVEARADPRQTLRTISALGPRAHLALSPETPVDRVEPFLDVCDGVLVMSVEPGYGGQRFNPVALAKLAVRTCTIREKDIIFFAKDPRPVATQMNSTANTAAAQLAPIRVLPPKDDSGLHEVYFRPPEAYFEPDTLTAVLRRRLGVPGAVRLPRLEVVARPGTAGSTSPSSAWVRTSGSLTVRASGKPLRMLNELEWVEGRLFANVWLTDNIVVIDPADGKVIAKLDLSALLSPAEKRRADVLNGIAWQPSQRLLWVSGKNWPWMFALRLELPAVSMRPDAPK